MFVRSTFLVLPLLFLSINCQQPESQATKANEPSPAAADKTAQKPGLKPQAISAQGQSPDQAEVPVPVLVIGVDAFDLAVLKPLVAQGRMPTFAKILKTGAHGTLLSENEMRSPALWTTIATGRPRSVHGIYDFVTGSRLWPKDQRSDERQLVTSDMREVPALWNWASDAGYKVAVTGWLNTWPAEKVHGVMVSPYVAIGSSKQVTIKGNVYEDEPDQVFPQDRWPEIRALITSAKEVPEDLLHKMAPEPSPALMRSYPVLKKYINGLRWSLGHSLTMQAITLHLLKKDAPQLTMVYFEGADSLAHRFWLFRQPLNEIKAQLKEAGLPQSGAAALKKNFAHVVDNYYTFLDGLVGELLGAMPARSRVMILSDHGFTKRSGEYPLEKSVPFTGQHRLEGSLLVLGHGIAQDKPIYGATLYDIAPTLVDWLQLKPKTEFEGRSLMPRVKAKTIGAQGPHGQHKKPKKDNTKFRDQELERLKELGYIQ